MTSHTPFNGFDTVLVVDARTQAANDAGHEEWVALPATRAAAKAEEATRYFTGKPCKRGHIALRSRDGCCVECARERRSKWRAENPTYSAVWYAANKDWVRETSAKWYAENKARARVANAQYYAENKDKWREYRAQNKTKANAASAP